MMPPAKISGNFSVKKLWDYLNGMRDYLVSLTPRQGHGTRVHHSALGTMTSAQAGDVTVEGDGKFKFRGMWEPALDYKENDVVIVRAGQATEGSKNYNHGTFFCVRDHVASAENQPKEPTLNTGDTPLDPLESTGETDIWRTLAQGVWNDFLVAPFYGELPENLIPFNYARMYPGNVQVVSGTSTATKTGSLTAGSASCSGGGSSWVADVGDLPTSENAKFRLMNWCEDGKKYTAYFLCTEKKEVPGQ